MKVRRVRLTVNRALAFYNLRSAQSGGKAMTLHELARLSGVAATTTHRLARDPDTDPKAASSLSLDLATRIVTILGCDIDELLEVVDTDEEWDPDKKF